MNEEAAEPTADTAPTTEPTKSDDCPDPTKLYNEYRVTVSAAAKRSELYTADKTKIDEKYGKLGDAQKRFTEAIQQQKKAWEDLKCQHERIAKAIKLSAEDRKQLEECWKTAVSEADDATKPKNCDSIPECKKLPNTIAELRDKEELAEKCVEWYDEKFDKLAEFPEKLSEKITGLTTTATKLEDDLAAPNSDMKRIFVEWLAFDREFGKVKRWFTMTPAEYACELKRRFRLLLETRKKWICLQVAIHRWEEEQKFRDEAMKAKEGKLVDLVLECALQKQGKAETMPPYGEQKPSPYGEGEQKPPYGEQKPPPYGEQKPPPYGEGEQKPPYGEQKPPPYGEGEPPPYGEQKPPPYGEGEQKPPYGEQKPPPYGEGEPPPYGEQKPPPYGEGEPPPYGEQKPPPYGEQKPPPYGEQKPPPYGEQKPPPYGEQKPPPYGEGEPSPYGEQKPPPYGEGEPPPYGEQKPPPYGEQKPPPYGEQKPPPYGEADSEDDD